MKSNMVYRLVVVWTLAAVWLVSAAFAQEADFDKLANLPFADGRPTQEAAQTLRDELLF